MITWGPPGASSSARKLRPSAGSTPSVGSRSCEYICTETYSGSPFPVSVMKSKANAAKSENAWFWSR
ncbi:hypothetical protein OV079_22095 [Nannocystis pusilla]|uniref:Uncharacterized protein n=1 Tax=Nannocystis pusilla TaxID=889268 RepID=A0A9X3IYN0_9BACT|nr:hypothetical protein [Nannocystis pusilla]MCY1008200.1 hypothetical protein [Nannocystis pusilla]